MKFGTRKLESWGYQMVRNHDASFLRFDTMLACDRRTDGYVALAEPLLHSVASGCKMCKPFVVVFVA